jgi:teichoic acid transport system permease protein
VQPSEEPFSSFQEGLRSIHRTPGWTEYLTTTWHARDFALAMAWSRVKASTRGQRLGAAWIVLSPLLEGLAYYLVFGLLLGTGRGIDNFVGFLLVGIFCFRLMAGTLTSTARCIEANRRLTQSLVHPRLTLALAAAGQELIRFVPAVVVMLLLVWVVPPPETVNAALVVLAPVTVLGWLFGLGAGMAVARFISRAPDVGNLLPFITRIWLFTSGVFYSIDRIATEGSTLRTLLELNPAHLVLDLARAAVLEGQVGPARTWTLLAAWTTLALCVGLVLFRSGEARFADD